MSSKKGMKKIKGVIPHTDKMHGWAEKGRKSKRTSRKRVSGK